MPGTQTKRWQERTLEAAAQRGELGRLYWFIEMEVPAHLRPRPDARYMPASYPPGFVPVVAAGPDWQQQREYAQLLTIAFETGNAGRPIQFAPALTDVDLLKAGGFYYYEFGEQPHQEIDHICALCGTITRARCSSRPRCTCGYLAPDRAAQRAAERAEEAGPDAAGPGYLRRSIAEDLGRMIAAGSLSEEHAAVIYLAALEPAPAPAALIFEEAGRYE